jgi:hypothetical protein
MLSPAGWSTDFVTILMNCMMLCTMRDGSD